MHTLKPLRVSCNCVALFLAAVVVVGGSGEVGHDMSSERMMRGRQRQRGPLVSLTDDA